MRRKFIIGAFFALCAVGAAAFALSPAHVPPEAIQSSVIRSDVLMGRAWQLPVAVTFKQHIDWQSNASLCGPASVANVFRSLGEQVDTESEVLSGTGKCLLGFCIMGLTLDELADVVRTHDRKVTILRDLAAEEFHEELRHANDPGRRYIVNFSREKIFGAGAGHHSPIGGYLEAEDLVLVLDVNRDFQPWLIERPRLFDAMNTFDGNKKRGMLLIEDSLEP